MVTDSRKEKYISKRHRQRPNTSSCILSRINYWWQAIRLCKEKRRAAPHSAAHSIRQRRLVQLVNWPCPIPGDNSSLAQQNIMFTWFVPAHTNHIIPCMSWKTLYTPEHHQYFVHLPGNTQEIPMSSALIYTSNCGCRPLPPEHR